MTENKKRKCWSCKKHLSLDKFGACKTLPLGREYRCKECGAAARKKYYKKNRDIILARNKKWRDNNRNKCNEQNRRYNSKFPEKSKNSYIKYTTKFPEKRKAIEKLKNAIRAKKIKRPSVCEFCKKPNHIIHGHHEDYNKPLDVIWLCPLCHSRIHKSKQAIYSTKEG